MRIRFTDAFLDPPTYIGAGLVCSRCGIGHNELVVQRVKVAQLVAVD
jgi:hypothetical protein